MSAALLKQPCAGSTELSNPVSMVVPNGACFTVMATLAARVWLVTFMFTKKPMLVTAEPAHKPPVAFKLPNTNWLRSTFNSSGRKRYCARYRLPGISNLYGLISSASAAGKPLVYVVEPWVSSTGVLPQMGVACWVNALLKISMYSFSSRFHPPECAVAVFSTGFGFSISRPQKPSVHALNLADGTVRWQESTVDTSYAPCMGVPGLALCAGTPRPNVNVFDRSEGALLKSVQAAGVPGGVAAGATVVGGQMFVGAGTGAFNEGADAEREATRDTPLSAFCVQGTPGCVANTCTDGNPCTYDYRARAGSCVSEPGAEGLDCKVGG